MSSQPNQPVSVKEKSSLREAAEEALVRAGGVVSMGVSLVAVYYAIPFSMWCASYVMNPDKPFVPTPEERQSIARCQRAMEGVDLIEVIAAQHVKETGKKMPLEDLPNYRLMETALKQSCEDGIKPPPRETLSGTMQKWDYAMGGSPHSVSIIGR